MKISTIEEYGLRCLLRIGREGERGTLTIPQISAAEKLTNHNVAKLLRILRRGGYIKSIRGQAGGYVLAMAPEKIVIGDVLALLGGRLFDVDFCDRHAGVEQVCTNSVECSVRTLWSQLQYAVDSVVNTTTLQDLLPKPTVIPPDGIVVNLKD